MSDAEAGFVTRAYRCGLFVGIPSRLVPDWLALVTV